MSLMVSIRKKPAKRTLLVLIDFSKAFDTVWRQKLLNKLIEMNLPMCMINWIKDYLSGRNAQVKLDNTYSKSIPLKQGVPQGGVLSPTIFTLFINDIITTIEADTGSSLFADDLAIWT